jgi:iron complex transport system substrate-binding protein
MKSTKLLSRLVGLFLMFALLVSGLLIGAPTAVNADTTATEAAVESGVFPRTVKDGAGNELTIKAKPVKIVSVSLASDEILLGIVDHARIAAVTANALDETQSNVAEVAKTIPVQLAKADPEAVIALKPDLVFISSFTDAGVIKQIQSAGVPVYLLTSFSSIKEIQANILNIGVATGDEIAAQDLIEVMEDRLKEVADALKDVKEPKSVIYYGPGGYSVGPGTTIDEIITLAGATNAVVKGGIKDMFPQLSDEFMVTQDPDYVLLAGFNAYAPGFVENFNKNPAFQTLKAIKSNQVVVVNDAHVASVSQYAVEGVSEIAALLYPDLYTVEPAATENAEVVATLAATASK